MMKIKNYILLVALSLPFFIGCAFAKENTYKGPGFDCAKARTITEKTICSDEDLSRQDWQISETYYAVKKSPVGEPYVNLINTQHSFLKERNRCKDDKLCIEKITSTRITQLKTLYGKQISSNCSDEDKEYSRSWGVSAEEAFNFGLKIQKIIEAKDLQALLALVEGELEFGPRKAFIKGKKFADIFSPDWQREVLMDEPPCRPIGYHGFVLAHGDIYYAKDQQASSDGTWKIFKIIGASEEKEKFSKGKRAWIYKGKELTVDCFTTPWLSGDNYEFYYTAYLGGDKKDITNYYKATDEERVNHPYAKALKFIGRFIGKQIPIEPVLWDTDYINLAVTIKKCTDISNKVSSDDDREGYTVIKSIPRRFCKTLAPNYPDNCHQLRLITVYNFCGGSMGCDVNTGIYGIVDDPKTKETYVVPLVNLGTLNDALNFVDELEKGTPAGGSKN